MPEHQTEYKKVLRTTIKQADVVVAVTLADAKTGQAQETLTATREHPFYVDGKGFTPAGGLAIGNAIVTRAGPALVVTEVKWLRRPENYDVYNFVVDDLHTYFVGNAHGGAWVHNPNCIPSSMQTLDLSNASWRQSTFSQNGLVYLLKDAQTGEILKVGQTTSGKFLGRFEKYVTAGTRNNRSLTLDVFETPLTQRGQVEGEIRRNLGRPAGSLPWDNTGRRLGRPGPGVP